MEIVKLDDYQSWLVRGAGTNLLVDPWLTDEHHLPPGRWFFARGRVETPVRVAELPHIDALLLSAHFVDHFDPATLRSLDRSIPVHATAMAARMARKLGFRDVHAHRPGEAWHVGGLVIRSIAPDFPYRHNSLGFVFEEPLEGHRIYLETHVADAKVLASLGRVDALVTTCESVKSLFVQFSMDADRALHAVETVRPRFFLPTGLAPTRSTGWFARTALRTEGTVTDFAKRLDASGLATTLVELHSGESLSLASGTVSSARTR